MAKIKPDPKNARRHPARNREIIRRSLEEIGAFRSIAVDGDDIIRAGNGVYEQAQELGIKIRIVEAGPDELIAVKRSDLRGDKAEKAALYDNQAGDLSEWDADILALLADESPQVVEEVFEPGEIESFLDEAEQRKRAEEALKRDPSSLTRSLGNAKEKIRPVLYAEDLVVFEQAIRAAGMQNRGQALIKICRSYLDSRTPDEEPIELATEDDGLEALIADVHQEG